MVLFRLHTTAADTSGQTGSPVTWGLIYTIVLTDQFTQITKKRTKKKKKNRFSHLPLVVLSQADRFNLFVQILR